MSTSDRAPEQYLRVIGTVRSCYPEKFGIPRQAGLAPSAEAHIEIHPPYDREEAFRGLEDFSHIWVVFLFHGNKSDRPWSPTVRPPRLGGNRRLGVFATRSPFRPNPLGLSAVRLGAIQRVGGILQVRLSGGDFLDGTPVVDIKPYLPYTDAIDEARGGFAAVPPEPEMKLQWETPALEALSNLPAAEREKLFRLVEETLCLDPRPAYIRDSREFACLLGGWNLRWQVRGNTVHVVGADKYPEEKSRTL